MRPFHAIPVTPPLDRNPFRKRDYSDFRQTATISRRRKRLYYSEAETPDGRDKGGGRQ